MDRPDAEIQLVKVFETGNPSLIAIAESLLDDAGIDFLTKNQNLQDFIAGGRIGASYNISMGPAQFWVRADDEDEARSLLHDIDEGWEE